MSVINVAHPAIIISIVKMITAIFYSYNVKNVLKSTETVVQLNAQIILNFLKIKKLNYRLKIFDLMVRLFLKADIKPWPKMSALI